MVNEEEFDVILLEFFERSEDDGELSLAIQLRERFPEAIIVLVQAFGPHYFQKIQKAKPRKESMNAFALRNGFDKNFIHDPNFREIFLASDQNTWINRFENPKDRNNLYHENVMRIVGAYSIKMTLGDGPRGWLDAGNKYLAEDSKHPSAAGHNDIARQVKRLVDRVGVPKQRKL